MLLLLGLVALSVRLLFLSDWADTPLFFAPQGDELNFHQTALDLLRGRPLGDSLYQPLYAFYLYLVYRLAGPSVPLAHTVNLLIGLGTIFLFYGLGRELGRFRNEGCGRWTGRLCALLAALYGPQVFFEGMLLAPVLVVPALAGALWALLHGVRRARLWPAPVAGVLVGIAFMDRPNLVFVLPAFALWLLGLAASWSKRLLAAALALAGLAVGMLPSWLYNASQGEPWVPVSSSGGHSFFIGNNPNASGAFHVPRGLPIDDSSHQAYRRSLTAIAERAEGQPLKLSEVSSFWYRKGLQFWREQPGAAIRLSGRKLLMAVGSEERPIHIPYHFAAELAPVLDWLPGFSVLLAFAVLAALAPGPLPGRKLLFGAAALYLLSLVVFYVADRYRIALLPMLAPLAALGMVDLYRLSTAGRRRPWLARVGVLLLVFSVSQLSRTTEIQRARAVSLGYNWLGKAAGDRGDMESAERAFRRSVEAAGPGQGAPARTNLGILLERRGNLTEAKEHYLEAARASARWKEARLRLARIYEAEGNLEEALRWWREIEALEAEPEKIRAHIEELEHRLENAPPPEAGAGP